VRAASVPVWRLSILVIILSLLQQSSHANEENDLWLLISSFEDIVISASDLATFLIAHGYNAKPYESYVIVNFTAGKTAYLNPNGGSPRLADLWLTPPERAVEPKKLGYDEIIKKNATYAMSSNPEFIKTISRSVLFPLVPLGMRYDGSRQLGIIYTGLGYNVTYMFYPNNPGYEWVLVEDGGTNTWLAVDSYYGVMTSGENYTAPYSFPRFELLSMVNPQWRVA
jgi:hypothetical protein